MKIVIVGGGSAGLFAAHRLADLADVTLVEAGVDPGHPTPPHFLHEHAYPEHDWSYSDVETGRHLVRGKVLGGSSTVNASAGVRGGPADFDAWGQGWTWDETLPALRAVETDVQYGDAEYHGDSGPVRVTRLEQGPLDDAFEKAALEAGYPACPDHNALGRLGVGPWPTNRVEGGRWGTLPAVAPLVRDRITLRAGSPVEKVLFDGDRAVGVEVDGERIDADLVILSAGAYGTPELLWRSGVEIPGIGENLQDHPWVMMNVLADPEAIMVRPVSGGLLRAGLGGDDTDELQVFPFSEWLYNRDADRGSYCVSVAIMQPHSRGTVSRGPDDRAIIALKHLSAPEDLARMLEAVGVAADLIDRMAAGGSVTVPEDAWWKGPDVEAELRSRVETYNHPVGTCSIGTVVDSRLRVNGYENLRIIDASVMPKIVQANTNLAAMAIGWRGAGFVAEDQ